MNRRFYAVMSSLIAWFMHEYSILLVEDIDDLIFNRFAELWSLVLRIRLLFFDHFGYGRWLLNFNNLNGRLRSFGFWQISYDFVQLNNFFLNPGVKWVQLNCSLHVEESILEFKDFLLNQRQID